MITQSRCHQIYWSLPPLASFPRPREPLLILERPGILILLIFARPEIYRRLM